MQTFLPSSRPAATATAASHQPPGGSIHPDRVPCTGLEEEPTPLGVKGEGPGADGLGSVSGDAGPAPPDGDPPVLAHCHAVHASLGSFGAHLALHRPDEVIALVLAQDSVVPHLDHGGPALCELLGQDGEDPAPAPEKARGQDVAGGEGGRDEGLEQVDQEGHGEGGQEAPGAPAGGAGVPPHGLVGGCLGGGGCCVGGELWGGVGSGGRD